MKKFFSILLALTMILTLSIPALAADTTITIVDTDRTYNGYKLLNLTTSQKTEAHPAACTAKDGGKHVDGCYNYAYSVNEKYEAILQEQAGAGRDIIAYLASLTGDNNTATLRPVANAIYRAIQEHNQNAGEDEKILPDAIIESNTQTKNVEQGYWLFADVSNLKDNEDANSLVMVDTAGIAGVTITPKTALPTVEKKVKDDEAATPNWQDSADYDIGDTIPFKLKGTLPANLTSYKNTYSITFHDKLSEGMTLNERSFKVYADGRELTVDTDYEVKTTGLADANCTFEVVFPNVLAINGVTKNTLFEIFYDATLDENAVIGQAGNPNEVYMEFSNDPYGISTGKTEKDVVKVFTYELIINKIDGVTQDALAGASFKLSKKNAEGEFVLLSELGDGENVSSFTWVGLDAGEYQLEETNAPEGYNKLDDVINFTISAKHDIQSANPQLTELTSTKGTAAINAGTITETIKNNTGSVLPETGAMGTMWLIFGGAMLVMVAAVFMITRKKMSVFED